jgi:hypothetical protein
VNQHRHEGGRRDVDNVIPTIRKQRQVNFGNTVTLKSDGAESLLSMSQTDSSELLLVLEALSFFIPPAALGSGDWRPYARVEWGHGAIDVSAEFEITGLRQRIPLAGSAVSVKCFIKALPLAQSNGTVLFAQTPALATATIRGFVADGTDAEPLFPTQWLTQMGLSAGLLIGPQGVGLRTGQQARLVNLRAFAFAGGGPTLVFLQLFDQPTVPVNGNIPVDVFPLLAPPSADPSQVPPLAFGQSRPFAQGLGWALSSTPYVLTLSAATAFVSAEVIQ